MRPETISYDLEMATSTQDILVGTNVSIGKVSVDTSRIMADGGPTRPHLAVPIQIGLSRRDEGDGQLAIAAVTARLCEVEHGPSQSDVCSPVTAAFLSTMQFVSQKYDPHPNDTFLRFPVTSLEVAALEARRHSRPGDLNVTLYLALDLEVIGLQLFGAGNEHANPWGERLGLGFFPGHFWQTMVQPLTLQIAQQTWVEKVLPGLGYDRLRLVELTLPPALPGHASAGGEFDKAKRALDERRYGDCVAACRGLVNIWNRTNEATRTEPMSDVVGKRRGWSADDQRRSLLDGTWKAVTDAVNSSVHPEGEEGAQEFDAHDARFIFNLVAVLSEYLDA
jgi:hypothetical protein